MREAFIQIIGKEDGPTSVILAGVHGNERCGVDAFDKMLPNLTIDRGCVWFGYGNPQAIEANVRFTEANLNRMFKDDSLLSELEKQSYEYARAQYIKQYLDQADVLLDIHASFTPESKHFAICEPNAKGIVEYLPVDLVVAGFDAIQPGGTDSYMNSAGKIGICIECGYLGDPTSTERAEQSIFAFLNARGHNTSSDMRPQQQSYMRMYELYKTKTDQFVLSKPFDDFEVVSKGQVIGTDGNEEIRAEKDSIIVFARNRNQKNDEAFLLGEKKNTLA